MINFILHQPFQKRTQKMKQVIYDFTKDFAIFENMKNRPHPSSMTQHE
jgi:hypothetical protein